MRILASLLVLLVFGGCGSKSADTPAAVALAINNPINSRVDPDAAEAGQPDEVLANPAVTQLAEKAKAAAAAGKHALAIEALSQAIGMDPRNSSLFHMRGDVYSLIGEGANARADLSLAIACDPQNAKLYNVRGYFLMTHGATDDALKDFDQAIVLNPEFAAAYNNRGLIHLAAQSYDQAVEQFDKAVALDRKYPDALNNRGFANIKLGDVDAALDDLQATVKLKPDYTTAWNNLGLARLKKKEYAEAVDAFSEAIRLAPYDARWLGHRRAAFQKLEKFEQANADQRRIEWLAGLNQLTQMTTARPNEVKSWITRAQHLAKGEEYAAAAQDFSQALKLEPANTEALNGRASAWLQAGEIRNAIQDCDVSLVTTPTTAAFAIRGDAWFALKNYDQAIQDFEASQKFDENVAAAYRKRAAERKANGDEQAATGDIEKAEQIEAALAGKLESQTAAKPLPFPEELE